MSEAQNCTPPEELRRQIMSHNEPKNEREWWACHRIEALEAALREIRGVASQYGVKSGPACAMRNIARAALAGEKKDG